MTKHKVLLVISINEWLTTTHNRSSSSITELKHKWRQECDLLGGIVGIIPSASLESPTNDKNVSYLSFLIFNQVIVIFVYLVSIFCLFFFFF